MCGEKKESIILGNSSGGSRCPWVWLMEIETLHRGGLFLYFLYVRLCRKFIYYICYVGFFKGSFSGVIVGFLGGLFLLLIYARMYRDPYCL